MSNKDTKPAGNEGELSDKQLDGIAGGQEVKKMETIVVTAKREHPEQVVKMERIVVTAKRDKEPSTNVATADAGTKKN
jgi:hypothetical protein